MAWKKKQVIYTIFNLQNRILIIGVGVFASAHLTREGELLVWVLFILVRFFFSFVLFIIILLLLLLLITITISTIIIIIISDITIIIIDVVVFNLWHLVSVRPVSN